ncbi:hypothetical protein BH10ACI1_BH10ACI1_08180 [soil metagenome]
MQVVKLVIILSLIILIGCQKSSVETPTNASGALGNIPAVRLNYRFEPDVPAPPTTAENVVTEEINPGVQADFSTNRVDEILVKMISSPDKQRVLVVYRKSLDSEVEFRLDMYAADGKILRKITYDGIAVYYPGSIVWSPDSKTVAFMAKGRGLVMPTPIPSNQTENVANTAANSKTNANTNANNLSNADAENTNSTTTSQTPPVEPAKAVLTMRTEQIYICGADGEDVKLLTQREGLIYFYFVWSPDSSMLVALAATNEQWQIMQYKAKQNGEFFLPFGRPRLIEKTGRERLLDDYPTNIYPVWSPDSAKVAVAYDKTIKIYDVLGTTPTQAAIPLQNPLLLSSKTHKENMARQEQGGNENTVPANTETNANQVVSTEIDEDSKVWFNPVIDLKWTSAEMLYLQTGYQKLYENSANNVRSYFRWHRLIFSPQAVAPTKQN